MSLKATPSQSHCSREAKIVRNREISIIFGSFWAILSVKNGFFKKK